ncbi:MAG: hypothetical protein U0X92_09925 [Anaerolineales bacterium]
MVESAPQQTPYSSPQAAPPKAKSRSMLPIIGGVVVVLLCLLLKAV